MPDIDAGMQHWLHMGYGPFLTLDVDIPTMIYRGQASPLQISMAYVQAGDLMVELVQQRNSGPSAYRDMFAPNEGGFHHICWICDDYEKEKKKLVQRGFSVANEGSLPGLNFCFVDTRTELGCMVELVPDVPLLRGLYHAVRAASMDWDGRNPIRPVTL